MISSEKSRSARRDAGARTAIALAFAGSLAGCGGAGGVTPPNLGSPVPIPTSSAYVDQVDQNGNDWPGFRRDNQRTGYNPYQTAITKANVATLAPKWTNTTHGVFAGSVVMNGVVYQGDLGGVLYAWNLSTGAQLWQYSNATPPNGNSFQDTPAFYHGALYLGDYGLPGIPAAFRAINASNGTLIWHYTETSYPAASFQSSPLVAHGLVYEGEGSNDEVPNGCDPNHQLIAMSLVAPTVVSALNIGVTGTGPDIWASPTLDPSGNLYVASGNVCGSTQSPYQNAIMRITTGSPMSVIWSYQGPITSAPNDYDFGSTPTYVNGMIVDANKYGYVYALNPATGALIWQSPKIAGGGDGIIGSSGTDGTKLYVPVSETARGCAVGAVCGALVALNLSNGTIAWSIPTHEDAFGLANMGAPAISQGIVFAAFDQTVWALDASNGTTLWKYPTGHSVYAGPTIVNGGLLIGNFNSGGFYCFTPHGL